MSDSVTEGRVRLDRDWLLLIALLMLVTFHYVTRPDLLGVLGAHGSWVAVSRPAVGATLHFGAAFVLLALIPAVFARVACRLDWHDIGLDPRSIPANIGWLIAGIPIALLVARVGAADPALQHVYPLFPADYAAGPVKYEALDLLYYGSWEILFRGTLLFALRTRYGSRLAIVITTAMSTLSHYGKPLPETLSAIPFGLLFGYLALRMETVWIIVLVHWTAGIGTNWFAALLGYSVA